MKNDFHSEGPKAPEEKGFPKFFVSSWGKSSDGKPSAPVDDEWSDLLLELTLATAYSSLMSNTGLSDLDAAVSFIAYFSLVWWIWASQVAYNTRFRTRDWVHRLFSGAQFVVFCALATFSNFSIGGIVGQNSPDFSGPLSVGPIDYSGLSTNILYGSAPFHDRQLKLPIINDVGIAVTMGFSRVFLCAQYLFIFLTARPHRPKRLLWHIISLLLSSLLYFGSALYIHFSSETILPLLLWFVPTVIEVVIHLGVAEIKGHPYDSRSVAKRTVTLFIIVLGEGLNQNVGTFKYVIGEVGMTWRGPVIMLCVGVIVIGELSLYCHHNWEVSRCGPRKTLIWFFSHFWLMTTLILTLQAVRSLVLFANMYSELRTMLSRMDGIIKKPAISDAWNDLVGLGIPYEGFVDKATTAFANPQNSTAQTQLAQALIYVASVVMSEFNALPPSDSPLFKKMTTFLSASDSDPNMALPLLSDLISSNLVLARWFWGFAGASLIILAFLQLMIRIPKDIFEIFGVISRFTLGAVFFGLIPVTFNRANPWFDGSGGITANMHESWFDAWAIPIFAIGLVLMNALDLALRYHSRKRQKKSYHQLPAPDFEEDKTQDTP